MKSSGVVIKLMFFSYQSHFDVIFDLICYLCNEHCKTRVLIIATEFVIRVETHE